MTVYMVGSRNTNPGPCTGVGLLEGASVFGARVEALSGVGTPLN